MSRVVAMSIMAGGLLLIQASPARAHAMMIETEPVDGAHLMAGPDAVVVTFNEPVEVPAGALRVFDRTGRRVDGGDVGSGGTPEQIRVSIDGGLADGAYVASWRVISQDGHLLQGALVFHVGQGTGEVDESLVAELSGRNGELRWAIGGAIARWLTYTAGLGAVGVLLFLVLVGSGGFAGAQVRRMAGAAAVVGIVGTVVEIPIFAAQATGLGLGALTSAPALTDVVTSSVGRAALVRSSALVLVLVAARGPAVQRWAWPALVGLVAGELLVGHTLTGDPLPLVVGADAVHLFGVAFWLGGLAALIVTLRAMRREDDPATAAGIVGRFSSLATWSVVALVVAGLALAWAEVRTFGALTSTTYGWTLLAKSGLAVAVLGLATYNRRALVPAITRMAPPPVRHASVAVMERTTDAAWSRLGRTVRYELLGLAAVLAVTAVLVNLQPAAEAAGSSAPFATMVPFGDSQASLVVDPNRVGSNEIEFHVLNEHGHPADMVGEAVFELALPAREIGPIVREAEPAGPGHWTLSASDLTIAGVWEITFRLTDGFQEDTATVQVQVDP